MNISGYHIHIYCQPEQIPLAREIRELMVKELAQVIGGAGPVRNGPVGPHPLPMFEAWFRPEGLAQMMPWILEHRKGLPILIHPITGDDYTDHAEHAIWIGGPLPLNLDILKG